MCCVLFLHRLLVLAMLILAGCGAVGGEDVQATLAAGDSLYATESAQLAASEVGTRADLQVTLEFAETRAAQIEGVNRQIYSTLIAISSPTPTVSVGQVDESSTGMTDDMDMMDDESLSTGTGQLVKTGVTDQIDANGCVVNSRSSFSSGVQQLYVTMQAFDVAAGTPLRAEWYYEDTLRVEDEWNVDVYSDDRCLWFILEAGRTEFTPGNWSVSVYVEGQELGSPTRFTITN